MALRAVAEGVITRLQLLNWHITCSEQEETSGEAQMRA